MQIDDFLTLARKRRSIRQFKTDPVPDEYVEKILEAARWSMSGANAQPWEFIVVKDQETRTKMAEATVFYREMTALAELTRFQEFRQPAFRTKDPLKITWHEAPVIIVVLGDTRTIQASTLTGRWFEQHTFDQNLANATHMICLAAASLGLGAQWWSVFQPVSEALKPILGVPTVIRIFSMVPIGYPDHKPIPYRRKLTEMVHYEKYDMSKFRSNNDIQEYIKYLRQRHEKGDAYQ